MRCTVLSTNIKQFRLIIVHDRLLSRPSHKQKLPGDIFVAAEFRAGLTCQWLGFLAALLRSISVSYCAINYGGRYELLTGGEAFRVPAALESASFARCPCKQSASSTSRQVQRPERLTRLSSGALISQSHRSPTGYPAFRPPPPSRPSVSQCL